MNGFSNKSGRPPGEAHAGPPGPTAGLNKYAAQQTCWQLRPDMAAAVCVVALRGSGRESGESFNELPGRKKRSDVWKWCLMGDPGRVRDETRGTSPTGSRIHSFSVRRAHFQGEKKKAKLSSIKSFWIIMLIKLELLGFWTSVFI